MRIQKNSKTIVCFFLACAGSLFLSMSNQAEAQVTYTVSGIFDSGVFDSPGFGSPLVADGEPFTAVFKIDDSVIDSDPDDSNRGEYSGAIVSSSFSFAGGFTSMVDFSGGNVVVRPDLDGGGIIMTSPTCDGKIVIYSSATLASDALLTSAQEINGDMPASLWTLTEPDAGGRLTSFSGVDLGQPMVLAITAAQPTLLGDCNLDGYVSFLDISPFIAVLTTGDFMDQADTNQSGNVDFMDISPFIDLLTGRSSDN